MYNNILVPLDGSKLAEATIPFLNEIISGAKESRKIEITLLQIIPGKGYSLSDGIGSLPVMKAYTEAQLESIRKPTMIYLEEISDKVKKNPMVTVKTLVKAGDDPADQILKTSDELKIDLIVISTHGRSGITRWALGSVADRILRNGTTPVFIVRSATKPR